MKIGIYGGSFDPVHKGHIKIAKICIEKLGLDKMFFVPAYKNPFKTKKKYVDSKHRINMLKLVLEKGMEISKFETNRKGVSYSIDTIRYFKNKFPNDEIFTIIGSDNLYKLNKWKDIDEIAILTKIVVYKRDGTFSKENIKRYNAMLIKNDILDYSSIEYRKGNLKLVDEKVQRYIANNFLYIKKIVMSFTEAKRYKHCIATGDLTAKYAKSIGFDSKRAWFAGFAHDITKNMNNEWSKNYLLSMGEDLDKVSIHRYHSLTAYYWLKEEYKLEDEEILNAIKIHTTLDLNLSILDKILYAADKLCEGRKFKNIQDVRKLMFEDFEKGFKQIVRLTFSHLKKENKYFEENQDKIYRKWS